MENSFIIIIAIVILTSPISWLEVKSYKEVIKSWRELEPSTYKEAGSPSEYPALSNLRIKYGYILNFDYIRKIKSSKLKRTFKKQHILFFSQHLVLMAIFLCAIYC